MSVRSQAVARRDAEIDNSQQRAVAAKQEQQRPMTALDALGQRLQVSPGSLRNTLMNTVFKNCSEAEFVAMVIVSNTYGLNPLLREIYAFPKKGGGIQAIVGYDGWIKIANSHPQFDGIEFEHIEGTDGNVMAVEGILHRKDRNHPTKKMVYLKEFKRNTDPWRDAPNHMLDVRAFCHTVRIGLGITGIGIEGEDDMIGHNGGPGMADIEMQPARLPREQPASYDDDDEGFDPDTGQVGEDLPPRNAATGMTEVDEDTARQLDAGDDGQDDDDAGEEETESERRLRGFREDIALIKNAKQLKNVDDRWVNARAAYDDDAAAEIDGLINAKRRALAGEN